RHSPGWSSTQSRGSVSGRRHQCRTGTAVGSDLAGARAREVDLSLSHPASHSQQQRRRARCRRIDVTDRSSALVEEMHLADPAQYPDSEPHTTPRWVKVFGIIALLVVLLFVVLLIAPGPHGPG